MHLTRTLCLDPPTLIYIYNGEYNLLGKLGKPNMSLLHIIACLKLINKTHLFFTLQR